MSATTRTGKFPIGFRRGGSDWQKDLGHVIAWAKDNAFACLDVKGDAAQIRQVVDAGLAVGSADLVAWGDLASADAGRRTAALEQNVQIVRDGVAAGCRNFFSVMFPDDPAADRRESFKLLVAGWAPLLEQMDTLGAKLVIEGYPGRNAHCCTPESYRAFFDEVDSPAAGVNYDPSHLIRMGIDPLRFLRQFVDRVFHVHPKDTELLDEMRYQLGHEQPPTFARPPAFGGTHWRYTIPGHGCMRWTAALEILQAAGYQGLISIELEDAHFHGSEPAEKQGLLASRQYLENC
jgi:sugar phosphate isomerase/epimerase